MRKAGKLSVKLQGMAAAEFPSNHLATTGTGNVLGTPVPKLTNCAATNIPLATIAWCYAVAVGIELYTSLQRKHQSLL